MKNIKSFMVLVLIAFLALAGTHLTMHSGEADAVVPGDSNMRGRYQTASTTPITDLNQLNGVTSNVQTQLDAKTTSSLADTKIFVGSAAGVATAQTMSGNATITNAGVVSISASAVNSPRLDTYTLSLLVANTASTNTVTGDASDLFAGYLLTTVGGINGANLVNDLYHDGFGNYTVSMGNALVGGDATWTLNFINSN
jgi:hypothetical protein